MNENKIEQAREVNDEARERRITSHFLSTSVNSHPRMMVELVGEWEAKQVRMQNGFPNWRASCISDFEKAP